MKLIFAIATVALLAACGGGQANAQTGAAGRHRPDGHVVELLVPRRVARLYAIMGKCYNTSVNSGAQ